MRRDTGNVFIFAVYSHGSFKFIEIDQRQNMKHVCPKSGRGNGAKGKENHNFENIGEYVSSVGGLQLNIFYVFPDPDVSLLYVKTPL